MSRTRAEITEPFGEPMFFQRKDGSRVLRCDGKDKRGDFVLNMIFATDMGFANRDFEIEEEYDDVTDTFDIDAIEKQTCGRRTGEHGPWKSTEGIDYWEDRDGRDACSFCGSARFELLVEVVDAILADKEGYTIERAKGYKYYLGVPGNSHIKFYTPHIPREIMNDEAKLKELNEKLGPACKKSHDKFMEKFNKKA